MTSTTLYKTVSFFGSRSLASLLSLRYVEGNFSERWLFIESRDQVLEMGRILGLVFSCCVAISLCSGIRRFSSVSSLTNQSDLVNTEKNCQKVSLKRVSLNLVDI